MRDGEPCPDCRWATYILSGRPVLVLRCTECMLWYHANIKIVERNASVGGWTWVIDAQFNHAYTRDDLNSILRCDCLARQVYMVHSRCCTQCNTIKEGSGDPIHRVRVRVYDTLQYFMVTLTKAKYDKSRLPAYTLQHRCGAIQEYLMAYTTAVPISEAQRNRVSAYAMKRQQIRDKVDAKTSTASTGKRKKGSDDQATGGGATPEPKAVVRRRSRA